MELRGSNDLPGRLSTRPGLITRMCDPSTEPNGVFRVNLVQGSLGDPISHGTGVSGPLNELGAASSIEMFMTF